MINRIKELISDKKVLILGFGREGQSTLNLLRRVGGYKSVGIADGRTDITVDGVSLHLGEGYQGVLDDYDVVFKSPGIVLEKTPSEYRCTVTSQVEQFLGRYSAQTVGVTGTKGKSTTSTLIHTVLSHSGRNTVFAGNIGIPVFDTIDSIADDTIIVLELSCHQLEYCRYSPHISVLLNLYEDHLDHYGTYEKYVAAKMNIFLNQQENDIVYCRDDELSLFDGCKSRVVVPDGKNMPFSSLREVEGVRLVGEKNYLNCCFVHSVVGNFGITDEEFISALKEFSPLPHRLERFATINGADYYDDSISTTVESAINAMESVENADTIIIGGMDRGIDYTGLVEYLLTSRMENIILIYASGKRISEMSEELKKTKNIVLLDDIYAAAEWALANMKSGRACLLSPAAASYGYFRNFEERGDEFKKAITGK